MRETAGPAHAEPVQCAFEGESSGQLLLPEDTPWLSLQAAPTEASFRAASGALDATVSAEGWTLRGSLSDLVTRRPVLTHPGVEVGALVVVRPHPSARAHRRRAVVSMAPPAGLELREAPNPRGVSCAWLTLERGNPLRELRMPRRSSGEPLSLADGTTVTIHVQPEGEVRALVRSGLWELTAEEPSEAHPGWREVAASSRMPAGMVIEGWATVENLRSESSGPGFPAPTLAEAGTDGVVGGEVEVCRATSRMPIVLVHDAERLPVGELSPGAEFVVLERSADHWSIEPPSEAPFTLIEGELQVLPEGSLPCAMRSESPGVTPLLGTTPGPRE